MTTRLPATCKFLMHKEQDLKGPVSNFRVDKARLEQAR
jgi:hypothetical protein